MITSVLNTTSLLRVVQLLLVERGILGSTKISITVTSLPIYMHFCNYMNCFTLFNESAIPAKNRIEVFTGCKEYRLF